MTKLNTYGFKMTGIKTAAGDTKMTKGRFGTRVQFFYDLNEQEIISHFLWDSNTWMQYRDPDVVELGSLYRPATMQEIADMIATELVDHLLFGGYHYDEAGIEDVMFALRSGKFNLVELADKVKAALKIGVPLADILA